MKTNLHSYLGEKIQSFLDDKIKVILVSATAILLIWFLMINPFLSSLYISKTTSVDVKNLIFSQLQGTNNLVTMTLSSKGTVKTKTENKFYHLYLGDPNLIYEGIGEIQAGIDLNNIEVRVRDDVNHTILVRLPEAKLINVFLDLDKSQTVYTDTNWFGPKNYLELQNEAQKKSLLLIQREACQEKILEKANEQAKTTLTSILKKVGFEKIEFETSKSNNSQCTA